MSSSYPLCSPSPSLLPPFSLLRFLRRREPLWALAWESGVGFLTQSLMRSLPLPPPPPPPATVTVTFPSPPHALQTPVPGRRLCTGFQSCSESHIISGRRFSGPWSLQRSLRLPPAWGGGGRGRRWVLLLISKSGQRFAGEEAGPVGRREVGSFPVSHLSACPRPPSRPSRRCIAASLVHWARQPHRGGSFWKRNLDIET